MDIIELGRGDGLREAIAIYIPACAVGRGAVLSLVLGYPSLMSSVRAAVPFHMFYTRHIECVH